MNNLQLLLGGDVILTHSDYKVPKYYRYNTEKKIVEYSPDMKKWKQSDITINKFLARDTWELVLF